MVKNSDKIEFLRIAEECKNNAVNFRNLANSMEKFPSARALVIFCYLTGIEEAQKGIFCLFVHRGWVKKHDITDVFNKHELKTILFREIFGGDFRLENGKAFLQNKPINKKNLEEIVKQQKSYYKQYMKLRNNCLYVGKDGSNWSFPRIAIPNFSRMKGELVKELWAMFSVYDVIKDIKFDTQVDNFQLIPEYKDDHIVKMTFQFDQI